MASARAVVVSLAGSLAVCLVLPSSIGAQRAEREFGTVRVAVRSAGGAPVGGAQVRVGTAAPAESNDEGAVLLSRLSPGEHVLRIRRIGYRPESLVVQATAGATVEATVNLAQVAIDLTPVTVVGRRDIVGPMAGFYQRQNSGRGRFITLAEIEKRNALNMTDLLRTIPGFRVTANGFRNNVRVRGSRCAPLVWLDGQGLFAGDVDLDSFNPMTFEGIEVYNGGASVPVEFQGNQRVSSSCGTIVLWSRQGEARAPKRKKGELSPAAQIALLLEESKAFLADDVERVAQIDSSRIIRPIYPDSLFEAQVSGRVLAEFVVKADGGVNLETFSAVTTTHRDFVEPVRRALREQRFAPALRDGRGVQQVVLQPFTFVPDSTARRRR